MAVNQLCCKGFLLFHYNIYQEKNNLPLAPHETSCNRHYSCFKLPSMKKRSKMLLLLALLSSSFILSGCPYKLEALSPKYWDDSMRETGEDLDDVFGARSSN